MQWKSAWTASRESLVVDIDWPEANDDHWKDGEEGAYAQGYEVGKDLTAIKVKQSLRAIGIRIKGEGDES
ncbi:Phage protein [Serratia fonticola AU-P3(3)]|nr:Phage protein [Serratia fonticola AU-P3(3)]